MLWETFPPAGSREDRMPELPEVETIRRTLEARVIGHELESVQCQKARVFQASTDRFQEELPGQHIERLWRRGKFLIFELSSRFLIFHLGMTGQLTFRQNPARDTLRFVKHPVTGLQRTRQHAPDKHTHFQLHFRKGGSVLYRDPRKFGRIFLLGREAENIERFFFHLGPEPLSSDFLFDSFKTELNRRQAGIKGLLLSQSIVAGVGNIYADEALFEAGVHPIRSAASLRGWEARNLFEAIPAVLQRGIIFGGTTLRDYVDSQGREGSNQERLYVYGRQDQPCRICETLIQKAVVAQRGTHFCISCQPRSPVSQAEWKRRRQLLYQGITKTRPGPS